MSNFWTAFVGIGGSILWVGGCIDILASGSVDPLGNRSSSPLWAWVYDHRIIACPIAFVGVVAWLAAFATMLSR